MHWLFFNENSPKALDEAGLSYDSTFGYNDAVGFRAGTTQVFCPANSKHLLELPLNIQDTAMFYPTRMHLSEADAMNSCKQLIEFATIFGGVLTLNWHTRSLSPERLWGDFYVKLLKQMQDSRVWFATADEIVMWFRKRRELRFVQVEFANDTLRLRITGPALEGQPAFLVRIHHPKSRQTMDDSAPAAVSAAASGRMPTYSDVPWNGEAELKIAP